MSGQLDAGNGMLCITEAAMLRLDAMISEVPEAGCWIWLGGLDRDGYGKTKVSGRSLRAPRLFYEIHRGPIPGGLELDHLCRTPLCVNPWHLEPVTTAENIRRAVPFRARLSREVNDLRRQRLRHRYSVSKENCSKGHAYNEANTRRRPNGTRVCRTCHREAANRANRERRAAQQP